MAALVSVTVVVDLAVAVKVLIVVVAIIVVVVVNVVEMLAVVLVAAILVFITMHSNQCIYMCMLSHNFPFIGKINVFILRNIFIYIICSA